MEAGPESESGFPGMGLTRGHETQAMEALGLLFISAFLLWNVGIIAGMTEVSDENC